MTDRDWLKTLKPGDEVARNFANMGGPEWQIGKVKRVLDTQFRVDFGGSRGVRNFTRNTGKMVGELGLYRKWLHEPTTEIRASIATKTRSIEALRVIQATRFSELPLARLEAIVAVLQSPETPNDHPIQRHPRH